MDDLAYLLPMLVFVGLTGVGGHWAGLYPASYVAKTLLAAGLLWWFWRRYTRIRWHAWGWGIVVGVLGLVQWVGMEKALLWAWPNYPRLHADPFDYMGFFSEPWMAWAFIAFRWAGAALLVPVMEELFWRDYVWRLTLAPTDFHDAEVGEKDYKTLIIVSLLFCTVHIQWMTAIVWGLMVGLLLIRTRSLGACIVAHAVTNALLGAYVLYATQVLGRQSEWMFW